MRGGGGEGTGGEHDGGVWRWRALMACRRGPQAGVEGAGSSYIHTPEQTGYVGVMI